MSRKTSGVAAFATALMFVCALFGANGSGAIAQDQLATVPAPTAEPQDAELDEIRFVPGEVVQPLDEAAPVSPDDATTLPALIASMPGDAALSRDLMCLASAIYYEARGETLEGQLAVGQVIVNRAQSGRFPQDYCGVVAQPAQFSFVRNGHIPTPPQHSAAWDRAVAIAQVAHREMWESAADDALFFHARRVRPSWASRKLTRASIDSHIFYR